MSVANPALHGSLCRAEGLVDIHTGFAGTSSSVSLRQGCENPPETRSAGVLGFESGEGVDSQVCSKHNGVHVHRLTSSHSQEQRTKEPPRLPSLSESLRLTLYYAHKLPELCGFCNAPPDVLWTAIVLFRRFFAVHSSIEFDPAVMMFVAVHVSCKIEEVPLNSLAISSRCVCVFVHVFVCVTLFLSVLVLLSHIHEQRPTHQSTQPCALHTRIQTRTAGSKVSQHALGHIEDSAKPSRSPFQTQSSLNDFCQEP